MLFGWYCPSVGRVVETHGTDSFLASVQLIRRGSSIEFSVRRLGVTLCSSRAFANIPATTL
jgi:hypothetical protein